MGRAEELAACPVECLQVRGSDGGFRTCVAKGGVPTQSIPGSSSVRSGGPLGCCGISEPSLGLRALELSGLYTLAALDFWFPSRTYYRHCIGAQERQRNTQVTGLLGIHAPFGKLPSLQLFACTRLVRRPGSLRHCRCRHNYYIIALHIPQNNADIC